MQEMESKYRRYGLFEEETGLIIRNYPEVRKNQWYVLRNKEGALRRIDGKTVVFDSEARNAILANNISPDHLDL